MTDLERVYLRRSRAAHLLPPWSSVNHGYPSALCGQQPSLFDSWRGTGSQAEHDQAAELPTCRSCDEHARRYTKRLD